MRSYLTVPLIADGELVGCLNLGFAEAGAAALQDQVILLELADVLAVAASETRAQEKERRVEQALSVMNHEMQIARSIQQGLYPNAPLSEGGIDIAGASYPAEAAGGDYLDYIPMTEGRVGVAVGDVTGHGLGAALVMASMRAYLRTLAQTPADVMDMLSRTNRLLLAEMPEDVFCTLLLGQLEAHGHSLVYANAGHPSGCVFDDSGEVKIALESTSFPLGALWETDFRAGTQVMLGPGDVVFLCTDGVLEATSGAGPSFGSKRALEVVRADLSKPAGEIVRGVHQAVRSFCEPQLLPDDVTVVVIKVNASK